MKLRHWTPLLGFVLPTVIIGYGFVIPRSCIAGVNQLTIGFATTVAGASLTYWVGVRTVLREFGALGSGRQCALQNAARWYRERQPAPRGALTCDDLSSSRGSTDSTRGTRCATSCSTLGSRTSISASRFLVTCSPGR